MAPLDHASIHPKRNDAIAKLSETSYYVAFAIYFLYIVINKTTYTHVLFLPTDLFSSIAKLFVFVLLLFKFLTQRTSPTSIAISIVAALISLLSWRQSGEGWLFWTTLFVICASGVQVRPLAKIVLTLSLLALAITVPFAELGLIENKTFIRDEAVRYAMGFTHPNALGGYLLSSCIAFSVLRFGNNPTPDLIAIALAIALNLVLVDSRTAALLGLVQAILLLIFYHARNDKWRGTLQRILLAAVILTIAVSLFFMVAYDPNNSIHSILNKLLSSRLRLANSYFNMKPLTLFGCDYEGFSPIYWSNGEPVNFLVDNAWCHLFLRYGLIATILFIAGYIAAFKKELQKCEWNALLFGLILVSIYGLSEAVALNIDFNFFLYAIGADVLYSENLLSSTAKRTQRIGALD